MKYLKEKPIAILGGGAVAKTCAADIKLAGKEVRLFDMQPRYERTIKPLKKTGILLDGIQRNLFGFNRSGKAYIDIITDNIEEAIKGVGIIVIATVAWAHEELFKKMIPYLEDGQVIHIFTDNYGSLLFRKLMKEMGCNKNIIIGGWASAPYGTRLEKVGGFTMPHVGVKYRAITLRGAAMPMKDNDKFIESTKYLPCMDAITQGYGPVSGNTILDIDFSNVNPVIHVPATILGVSSMENWNTIYGNNSEEYSMYSHGLCPSICEVQYQFYNEEIELANAIGVGIQEYKYESFFSRRSILTQEYMGVDENGDDNVVFPLDKPSNEGNSGPNNINHRYLTEDIPVNCKIYHELGKKFNINTPIIDSMIILGGAMHKKSFFNTSKYSLEYLGIDNLSKEELLLYLNTGEK